MQPILERARTVRNETESQSLSDEIRRFIEPFNVAGLGDPQRRNWYPADAEDMLRAAPKLGASREEVAGVLDRCGFQAS
jgi:FADH2 O2-dependent halogenase